MQNAQYIMAMKRNVMVLLLVVLHTTDAFVVTTSHVGSRAAVGAVSAVGNNKTVRAGSVGARGTKTRISATTGFFESLFSGIKVSL